MSRRDSESRVPDDPQNRIEREEFARGHVPRDTPPVEPRAAATVVVARPAREGFEVLLLERSHRSRFAAGAFVFPGGVLDEDDASPFWRERIPDVDEAASCVAALRELFEETGFLPGASTGTAPDPGIEEDRSALLRDDMLFSDIARARELDFSRAEIAYFSRWITPRTLARRYDTRFFLLGVAEGIGEPTLTEEHEAARWIPPGQALEGSRRGALPMLFPTRKTLERLASFDSLAAALDRLRVHRVEPILAKLSVTDEGVRPLMPGDPEYDDAY